MAEMTDNLRKPHDDDEGLDEAIEELIYDELKKIARNRLGKAGSDASLQVTELAHEGWMRLRRERYDWKNRGQFFGAAKKVMDRVLIDLTRKQATDKRNKGSRPEPLEENQVSDGGQVRMALEVAEAFEKVREADPRAGEVLRARVLMGWTFEEIADHLGEVVGVRDPKSLRALFKRGKTLFIGFYQTH